MSSAPSSDHDLLIALNQAVQAVREAVRELRQDSLENGKRLEALTILKTQQDSEIKGIQREIIEMQKTALRENQLIYQNIASLEKSLEKVERKHHDEIVIMKGDLKQFGISVDDLSDQFDRRLVQIKTIAWVIGPVLGIILMVIGELVKRWFNL